MTKRRANLASLLPPGDPAAVARVSILDVDGRAIDADLDRRGVMLFLEGLARQLRESERLATLRRSDWCS